VSHAICRVRQFAIVGSHTLSVVFDDDTTQTIDFGPMLRGPRGFRSGHAARLAAGL
jgi:hypothetical protein